ncbi:hypothetical protein BJ085DRAFT_29402 [Dimargaris cristalligena]|uniref:Uncharacterized protein n=1 Tax=Dimargaris cristalligena TaxID=215637 RepID=A0A4P9ZPA8_9FUNG|nr:hypothetical protein BJ085DRAFT_29402 [Dimargaris cristalligena]|eukprot:RKP35276.1 hypothetical protein BJ085DRAFT_29402 [Dimargaris cristalligena]
MLASSKHSIPFESLTTAAAAQTPNYSSLIQDSAPFPCTAFQLAALLRQLPVDRLQRLTCEWLALDPPVAIAGTDHVPYMHASRITTKRKHTALSPATKHRSSDLARKFRPPASPGSDHSDTDGRSAGKRALLLGLPPHSSAPVIPQPPSPRPPSSPIPTRNIDWDTQALLEHWVGFWALPKGRIGLIVGGLALNRRFNYYQLAQLETECLFHGGRARPKWRAHRIKFEEPSRISPGSLTLLAQ